MKIKGEFYRFHCLLGCDMIWVRKGCDNMGMAEFERKRDEKMDGVVYDMSPAHGYHGYL